MTNTLSFISANYVARQLDYQMTGGWGQGDKATQEHFRPLETFGERFEEILRDVQALGFRAMDLWTAHLNPEWATPEHIEIARGLLERYNLRVPSLGGWFGSTREEFEAACKLAAALGCPVLGGSTSVLEKDRPWVVDTLGRYEVKLGLENHPEKTPGELLAKIGEGGPVGAAVDTGWFGTQGYDAAEALEELAPHLVVVHLKDVREVGKHDTCAFGEGVVPIERCLETLKRNGYTGSISIEHEPEDHDPTDEVRASLKLVQDWMRDHD